MKAHPAFRNAHPASVSRALADAADGWSWNIEEWNLAFPGLGYDVINALPAKWSATKKYAGQPGDMQAALRLAELHPVRVPKDDPAEFSLRDSRMRRLVSVVAWLQRLQPGVDPFMATTTAGATFGQSRNKGSELLKAACSFGLLREVRPAVLGPNGKGAHFQMTRLDLLPEVPANEVEAVIVTMEAVQEADVAQGQASPGSCSTTAHGAADTTVADTPTHVA